jgi:hypothetical protein
MPYKHNLIFKHENGEILNLETSAVVYLAKNNNQKLEFF